VEFCTLRLQERLVGVKALLEEKIGESLEELDEYLHDYKVGPDTLMSLVEYYVSVGEPSHEQILQEIVTDVDGFLWFYANEGSISIETFINLVKVRMSNRLDSNCLALISGEILRTLWSGQAI
jgi:hypothetical protein